MHGHQHAAENSLAPAPERGGERRCGTRASTGAQDERQLPSSGALKRVEQAAEQPSGTGDERGTRTKEINLYGTDPANGERARLGEGWEKDRGHERKQRYNRRPNQPTLPDFLASHQDQGIQVRVQAEIPPILAVRVHWRWKVLQHQLLAAQ